MKVTTKAGVLKSAVVFVINYMYHKMIWPSGLKTEGGLSAQAMCSGVLGFILNVYVANIYIYMYVVNLLQNVFLEL